MSLQRAVSLITAAKEEEKAISYMHQEEKTRWTKGGNELAWSRN
jgi:hypothetical protein